MKLALTFMIFLTGIFFSMTLIASNKKDLKTDFNFRGSSVNGNIYNSIPATATVENEKVLRDVFDVRRDFKDRVIKNLENKEVKR